MTEQQIERMLYINKLEAEQRNIRMQEVERKFKQAQFEEELATMMLCGRLKAGIAYYKAMSEGIK